MALGRVPVAGRNVVAWVETHVGTLREARALAQRALEARLAACANLGAIESAYRWEGTLERRREVRVELKTDRRRLRALLEFVKAEHPYEVPYIAWGEGLQVTAAYRAWASRETGPARTRPRPAATRRGTRGTRRRT